MSVSLEDRFTQVTLEQLDACQEKIVPFLGKIFVGFVEYKDGSWYVHGQEYRDVDMQIFLKEQCTELLSHLVTQRMLHSFVGVAISPGLVERTYALKRSFDNEDYICSILRELPYHLTG